MKLERLFREKARENYEANVGRPSKSPQNSAPISHIDTRDELAKVAQAPVLSAADIANLKHLKTLGASLGPVCAFAALPAEDRRSQAGAEACLACEIPDCTEGGNYE
jgi:hypothetical protein